jgi:cytochrome d ubiquinol oxidase subunit I
VEAALASDRLQFAFTVMFHYLFPIGTMGLAPFVAWYTIRAARTGDPFLARAARFWTTIFAINFAIGVVTGIPMEFQFGTNWGQFSARTGSVIGEPLAIEGVFAFFLESIALGILLYGRDRVSRRLHAISAVLVCVGSWLSGFFIVATDAWMQHPVGFAVAPDGRIVLANLAAVLLSPFALWQYLHALMGALLTGGFLVAGVGAFYLLSQRQRAYGSLFLRNGIAIAFLFSALAIFPTGDQNGDDVTRYQPLKLAAMEGLFDTEKGAPLAVIGMPDTKAQRLIDPIEVPDLLSFLAYGNFRASVRGLATYPVAERPPIEVTYYAYHVMVGLGTIFIGLSGIAVLAWRFGMLERPWLLWPLMLAIPFPYIANEAGWVTSEVGRQPWVVYGLIRTADGVSSNVPATETIFTTAGFAGMYFLLGTLFIVLVLREIGRGPEGAEGMKT